MYCRVFAVCEPSIWETNQCKRDTIVDFAAFFKSARSPADLHSQEHTNATVAATQTSRISHFESFLHLKIDACPLCKSLHVFDPPHSSPRKV